MVRHAFHPSRPILLDVVTHVLVQLAMQESVARRKFYRVEVTRMVIVILEDTKSWTTTHIFLMFFAIFIQNQIYLRLLFNHMSSNIRKPSLNPSLLIIQLVKSNFLGQNIVLQSQGCSRSNVIQQNGD